MTIPNWAQAVLDAQDATTRMRLSAALPTGAGVMQCCRTIDGKEVCVSIDAMTECEFTIKT